VSGPATSRINPDTFYVNGTPIPASYFQQLDSAQAQAINGDAGGGWFPTAPINVGGAGMWCCGPWTIGTASNQQIITPLGSGKRIVLAANDLVELAPNHLLSTRTLVTPCADGVSCGGPVSSPVSSTVQPSPFVSALIGRGQGSRWLIPLRVYNGATLASASLTFFVSQTHVALPTMPQMRIYALTLATGVITPLGPTIPDIGSSGFQSFPAPANVGAYNGQTLTLTYSVNAGVVIDTSANVYLAEIVDESVNKSGDGATQGTMYQQIACQFTGISEMGFA
jgi:hypothetical protein